MTSLTTSMGLVALLALAVAGPAHGQAPATGQAPRPAETPNAGVERTLEGHVKAVDGKTLTLMDGTKLVVPPGSSLRPQVLPQGTGVAVSYRQEGERKVLTAISVAEPGPMLPPDAGGSPSASPPTEPPRQ